MTHHPSGRWEARIGVPGSKHIYLGLFPQVGGWVGGRVEGPGVLPMVWHGDSGLPLLPLITEHLLPLSCPACHALP